MRHGAKSLKAILDRFYNDFDFDGHVRKDPIEFPLRYKDGEDAEAAGFIASCLAYGRVELFKPVVGKILAQMGESPHSFLLDFDVKRREKAFTVKYRFNEREDILCLLFLIHEILKRHSALESCFRRHYSGGDGDTGRAITGFVGEIRAIDTSPVYGRNLRPKGLLQFFPSPAGGSACKRMNLFLRWMVRDKDIDLGLWKGIAKDRLIIPLDTHIARISRCIGLTGRASADWKAAVEITEALKKFDPEDPLKYDFALCHHGISGLCGSPGEEGCRGCFLKHY